MLVQGSLMHWGDKFSYVTDDIIKTGKYEMGKEELNHIVKKNWVSCDVGANIGYYTLMLSQLTKKVYAFEPEPENFHYLTSNINMNKYTNITPINKAVGDSNRRIILYYSNICTGMHRVYQDKYTTGIKRKVEQQKLDDLGDNIDFLKIDVEGWEYFVLNGAGKTLENVQIILMEHDYSNPYLPKNSHLTMKLLHNFDIYKHEGTPNYICINKK